MLDFSCMALCEQVGGAEQLLLLLRCLLAEQRIIVTGSHLTLISATTHALIALLYPLRWCHVFVPILPLRRNFMDIVESPVPFLVGVLKDAGSSHILVRIQLTLGGVLNVPFPMRWF